MKIFCTRDSVAPGDDVDAPHEKVFDLPDAHCVEEAINRIVQSGYLARIAGGLATWSVVSGWPIAVVARHWPALRGIGRQPIDAEDLSVKNGCIALHFNYHSQTDPEVVLKVLKAFKRNVF